MLTPKPMYILKALEKGFQNMYGFGGAVSPLEKIKVRARKVVREFPYRFWPNRVIFNGFVACAHGPAEIGTYLWDESCFLETE